MFCSAKSRKLVFQRRRLSSYVNLIFIYEQWLVITASWEDLAAVVFVSNKFMSSCVICLVIVREIFLLQSDCSAITKVCNFLLLSLLYNQLNKRRTLNTNWIFPGTDQFVNFFHRTFQRSRLHFVQNIFTALLLVLVCKKLNSKNARTFFIITVEFWVLSTWKRDEKHSWTRPHENK